jgi:integrase
VILSQAVEQYILHKRSLGMGFRGEAVRLRAFVQAIGDCDMHRIGPEPVSRFLEGNGPLTMFWFSKYHTLKAFYRYALARDSHPSLLRRPISPHTIRHTTATHLLRAGVDINTIRAWLGHVSIDTTNIYAEIDLQRKAEVLAHSNTFSAGPTTNKRWKDDPSLITFLRSL